MASRRLLHFGFLVCLLLAISQRSAAASGPSVDGESATAHRFVIFVWDGLRPDLINVTDTPNLAGLRDSGTNFVDHHSTYPTLTMINAASLATGAYPATHGFFGNSFWVPRAQGHDSANRSVDFSTPVFTEDYAILRAIDRSEQGKLLAVPTLFEIAHRAGIATAIVGKGGPTFLQSRGDANFFLDDKTIMPESAATALSEAGFLLPQLWANAYSLETPPRFATLNDLSAGSHFPMMIDGATSDPSKPEAVTSIAVNAYQAKVFMDYVLPKVKPQLAMLWLKNPDSTEHAYGPGSAATRNALHANDAILGALLNKLDELGIRSITNVIVVSDHGHSHISGSFKHFPLRAIKDGDIGAVDEDGFSVSGEVRSADLLRRAGLLAFDGGGAQCNPVMSGIKSNGESIYTRGQINLYSACKMGAAITGNFMIPDAKYLDKPYAVIALDGGSEYYYVPSHDKEFVKKLVQFFQTHEQYGAIFVDALRYGEVPGTLPLSLVRLQNQARNSPDLIVSYAFDGDAKISNVPGIEYCGGASSNRGMHGSFSPRDVHNTLIASGIDFRSHHRSDIPSANVDVAPTIAHLLGLSLEQADGRVLSESLANNSQSIFSVSSQVLRSTKSAGKLTMLAPTDPDGRDVDSALSHYAIEVRTKLVKQKQGNTVHEYRYYDSAQGVRYK